MSFKSTLNLKSNIFDKSQRQSAGGRAANVAAKKFRDDTRRKMVDSTPSGRIYRKSAGAGFTRSHRASKRGERPAVETGKLANRATKSRRLSDTSAETYIDTTVAPYAEILVKRGRVIMSAGDRKEAQKDLNDEVNKELSKLI